MFAWHSFTTLHLQATRQQLSKLAYINARDNYHIDQLLVLLGCARNPEYLLRGVGCKTTVISQNLTMYVITGIQEAYTVLDSG